MKIYTRTGDGGATTLFDGTRIAKSDPRVDAYGEVDEANAAVGVARAERRLVALAVLEVEFLAYKIGRAHV